MLTAKLPHWKVLFVSCHGTDTKKKKAFLNVGAHEIFMELGKQQDV